MALADWYDRIAEQTGWPKLGAQGTRFQTRRARRPTRRDPDPIQNPSEPREAGSWFGLQPWSVIAAAAVAAATVAAVVVFSIGR